MCGLPRGKEEKEEKEEVRREQERRECGWYERVRIYDSAALKCASVKKMRLRNAILYTR